MKKYSSVLMALLLAALMLVGCGTAETPATVAQISQEPSETAQQTTEAPETTEATGEEEVYEGDASTHYIDEIYAEQIERYYIALSQEWNEGQYYENEMCGMAAAFYEGSPLDNVGFGFADLDNDGYWELIIGGILNSETDPTVFEIWTNTENGPVMLAQSGYRNRYCLGYTPEDDTWFIANEGSNSAANSGTYFLMLQEGELKVVQGIVFDAIANEEAPWFMAHDLDWDTTNDEPIAEDLAMAIIDAYKKDYTVVEYFPYSLYK